MPTRPCPSLLPFVIRGALLVAALLSPPLTGPSLAFAVEAQPVLVAVAQVQTLPVPALITLAGTLQSTERAVIAAKLSGVITRMPIRLGSTVKAGELLAVISTEEMAARLMQAEAQLAQAKRNLEREQNLLAKNASTPETVKTMADQYAIAQAGYREAKTMAGYATITAPFDGVVVRKDLSEGDLATPGTPLLALENPRSLQVRAAVPESLMATVHPGDVLSVQVDAAGATVQGRLSEIAPAADPQSRTAPIVLDLPPQPELRSGQFARVLLPAASATSLFVPESAVVPAGQMDRVLVVADGRAHLRLVRTGMRYQGQWEILAGLQSGETVATGNHQWLMDGQSVRVQP